MTVILTFISWLARMIGWGGIAAIGILIYEEGIPGSQYMKIPDSWPLVGGVGISDVPIVGGLVDGRVKTYAVEQVKLSEAAMVSKVEADALKAQIEHERALRLAADQATTEAQKRADAARMAAETANKNYEALIAADTGTDGATWTAEDIQWLKQH